MAAAKEYQEKHVGAVTVLYFGGKTVGKVMPSPNAPFEDEDFTEFIIQGDRRDRVSPEVFGTRDEAVAELKEQHQRALVQEAAGL